MRDFRMVHTAFWRSKDIRALSEDGRVLALYLLTSEHLSLIGLGRLPDGYAADDLQWDANRVRTAMVELDGAGFARCCTATHWVWIVKRVEYASLPNLNVLKSAIKNAASIPASCSWREAFFITYESMKTVPVAPVETVSEPLANRSETVLKPLVNGSETVEGTTSNGSIESETNTFNRSETVAKDIDIDVDKRVIPIGASPLVADATGPPFDLKPDEAESTTAKVNGFHPDCPAEKLQQLFNEILPGLPRVDLLNKTRRARLSARWREADSVDKFVSQSDGIDAFREFFERVGKSDFLMGRAPPGNGRQAFRASFDWVIGPENFVKIAEGNYDN